ncbi:MULTISPECIES: glycosyltransferase [unclassified Nocardioides]|uniref:glycosyltransferase n=1 Tax=unclassified Nocardioides TaxID=2615069 RepID=UPI0006F37059|nr:MULTISPECIES: glycosyltransferase [unclassified Nocardioides]KRA38561.1 hypothetical protein ASD81_08075 [Nocardioides sp. Root614]KRA92521.1 hypothetical protein ASD84_08340 [Nocardioides sp. Root682]
MTAPVALIAFNRPHLTERTLAAVRAARPTELYLVVDGPRDARPDDVEKCAATRAVLEQVDWPCEVHRRYADRNLGLEANVELGLDWVFSRTDRAIVLEDDCEATPSFFRYADELLERYRDEPRVWQVSGSGLGVPDRLFRGDSYAFTAWASVWGWATWADRWQRHREVFPRDHRDGDAPVRTMAAEPRPGLLVTRSGQQHFAEAATSLDTVTHGWDKHWWLTMMTLDKLAISPSSNLVENIGWGEDATHGVAEGKRDHAPEELSFPLRHPAEVALNPAVEHELELVLSRVGGRAATIARRLVRSPRLRRVARTAVNSRAGATAHRVASQLREKGRRA